MLRKSVLRSTILCTTRTVTSHCTRVPVILQLLLCYLAPRAMTRDYVYKDKRPTVTCHSTCSGRSSNKQRVFVTGGRLSTRNEERGTREHLTSQLWGIKGAALSQCFVGFAYERVVQRVGFRVWMGIYVLWMYLLYRYSLSVYYNICRIFSDRWSIF